MRALVASIREIGIINPLRVRPARRYVDGFEADAYEVTAGAHRLAAARKIGFEAVPCIVVADDDLRAELAMIDENLCRAELSPAERARQTARRKGIYLQLHPETERGVAGGLARQGAATDNLSFADETAALIGVDPRTVRRDAERGEKISEAALALVAGTDLDTGSYLDRLKKLSPAERLTDEKRVSGQVAQKSAGRLERSEQIAEWVRLTEQKISAKLAETPKVGRPGGVDAARRELGVSEGAARRAVKIDGISPEAKAAAQEAGIADNQSALLRVAAAARQDQSRPSTILPPRGSGL